MACYRPRMRVVSLLPSATEIVCGLGARDMLVGISHECDFPAEVAGLPVLTRARVDAEASSRDIDEQVRAVVHDALSVYDVDHEQLAATSPDVIITQDLCEVCAVSLDDVRRAVAKLAGETAIVSLQPTTLDDVFGDVETVAAALQRPAEGRRLRAELEGRVHAVAERARRSERRPRVVTVEWLEPIMLGGTWMPDLVALAGGDALKIQPGAPAPTVSRERLADLQPDVVVIKPCGFDIERTMREASSVDAIASAVPNARLYVTDGNAYFNRPGPRLVESLEILAACADPTEFGDFAEKHQAAIEAWPP